MAIGNFFKGFRTGNTWLSNTLSTKLTLCFVGLGLVTGSLALYPWWLNQQSFEEYLPIKEKNIQKQLLANQLLALTTKASDLLIIAANAENWNTIQAEFVLAQQEIGYQIDKLFEITQLETGMTGTSLSMQVINKTKALQSEQKRLALLLEEGHPIDFKNSFVFLQSTQKELHYFTGFLLAEEQKELAAWEAGVMDQELLIVYATVAVVATCLIGYLLLHTIALWQVSRPLKQLQRPIQHLAEGKWVKEWPQLEQQEIQPILQSAQKINSYFKGISKYIKQTIADGTQTKSADVLDIKQSTGEMGESIRELAAFLESTQEKDEKRAWHADGINLFAELLRNNQGEVKQLCDLLLSELIKHLSAQQGAIYLLNEAEKLEMVACFAFGYHKDRAKEIEKHEGLVGEAFFEKRVLIIDEIPETYFKITTGLGQLKPKVLMIAPLVLNGKVIGILEVASRQLIEDYQRVFVEKVGESIASTILNIQSQQKTQLLLEKTRHQTEELQAQEEEMRQNMEELQATQEELHRQKEDGMAFMGAMDKGLMAIEVNINGGVLKLNSRAIEMLDLAVVENKKMPYHQLLPPSDKEKLDFGVLVTYLEHHDFCEIDLALKCKNGDLLKTKTNFIPIRNMAGEIEKIECISTVLDLVEGAKEVAVASPIAAHENPSA